MIDLQKVVSIRRRKDLMLRSRCSTGCQLIYGMFQRGTHYFETMSLFVKMDDVHGRCDFDGDGRLFMLTALERIPHGGCTT